MPQLPPIDWVHIAMFLAGLALQWLTGRGSPQPGAPTAPSAPPGPIDANMLLTLAHKLLDERRQNQKP